MRSSGDSPAAQIRSEDGSLAANGRLVPLTSYQDLQIAVDDGAVRGN